MCKTHHALVCPRIGLRLLELLFLPTTLALPEFHDKPCSQLHR